MPVTVTIPAAALAGEAAVTTLRATSQADTGVAATALLTATANAVYGVILDAAVTSGETLAGRTITYTVGVTNTGDYTDTFDLTVAGNAWPVTLSQDSVELGAQAGTAVQVEVAVPATASGGDSDTTTFTAMSRGDASVSESLSLTTTVRECVAVAGAAFSYTPAQPLVGQTVTFTGTVTAGTLPITYAWDFGDEGTASGAVVAHAFPLAAAVRPYTVTLTVTNACGQVSASHVLSVRPHQVYLPLVMRLSD